MVHVPTELMFFLPYTPRADADSRGYDDWIREIDNPFFNSAPGISHYSNWKVGEVLSGAIDFTHFDFMFVDPARVALIWSNESVAAFASGWNEQWGRDPQNPDLSVNYHIYQLEHEDGAITFDKNQVTVIMQPVESLAATGSRWDVPKALVGESPCTLIDVIFGPVPPAKFWTGAQAAFTGELIAAP
jgi:hypothetical protein